MLKQLSSWWAQRRRSQLMAIARRHTVQEDLWRETLAQLPFLACLPMADLQRLRMLVSLFLHGKEFSGAHGMQVSDAQAVMVGVQACLPILYIAPADRPDLALAWYDGFLGIVLHAGQVRAQREWIDEDGIAHSGSEDLTGEMQDGGPLMLAWSDVQAAGETASAAYNVVIHEFIHVMDVRDGAADGCPPMPTAQRREWLATLQAEFERFCEASEAWQRFGNLGTEPEPLLDAYGSSSIDEFFAVAAEAYFVQREAFTMQHPKLLELFDRFFRKM